jgi:Ni,Fe-hydrogenase maturation factor
MDDKFIDTDHEISLDSVVQMLNSEIQWCYKRLKEDNGTDREFRLGFTQGVEQAKKMIIEMARKIYEEEGEEV